jgi:hypothetical protein
MKTIRWITCCVLFGLTAGAESLFQPVNDAGYGTVSAKLRSVNMYRDFENATPDNAWSSTLGLELGYVSPEIAGFSAGGSYLYAEPVSASDDSNHGKKLLSNGRADLFNEAWLQYRMEQFGWKKTTIKAGRQIVNGEIFRADESRQKARSLEGVVLTSKDWLPSTTLTVGHAWRLSNIWDNKDDWTFKDFDKVLGIPAGADSCGTTWAEAVYTGITNLEIAVYDAYVHDIANVAGGRVKYSLSDETALVGYYRHENSVQTIDRMAPFESDMVSLGVQQKVGTVDLEAGYFGVFGDGMLFDEYSTGLNHPLGSSLMIYSGIFDGNSDTVYLKATAKVGKTSLYMLYDYTWHDHNTTAYDGQEINFVAKRPFGEHLSAAVKCGAGYREGAGGASDTLATDTRLFLTYTF